jgi:pimeloyl-ACP methyl ester carboxylesterase
VLGHDRATVVGHSLGGGIAMVFAYQFPERTERMVLVDSGGLGRDVSLALRAASLPGSELVLPLLFSTPLLRAGGAVAGVLGKLGLRAGPDVEEIARGISSFADVHTRTAFVHTVRAVIDPLGQRVSARDRLYLAEGMPTLVIWGDCDPIIPVEHGIAAAELMEGSRLEVFPGAGHFPHRDDPMRFIEVLADFLATTEPACISDDVARRLLQERAAA